MSDLPPGFVLDNQPSQNAAPALPDGFVLDQPSMAADVAKSAGIGLAKGALGVAGFKGDLGDLAASAAEKLGGYLTGQPVTPEAKRFIDMGRNIMFGPTSAELRQPIENVTGQFYQPKTVPGQYAQTLGEFVPGLVGGEGSLAARALKQVVAPALASETAGQLTKGTAAEPYARVAGGLVGAAAPAMFERAATAPLPTAAELKTAAKAAYQSPEVKGLQIDPQSVGGLSQKIQNDLVTQGFRPRQAGGTFDEVNGLLPGQNIASVGVDDIDSARKALGKISKEVNTVGQPTADAAAAKIAIRHIDNYLTNLTPQDVLAGDAQRAQQLLSEARGNYAAGSRAKEADFRLTQAERAAAKSGTGGNLENAMRQKIDKIKDIGLTPDEIAQRDAIVTGTPARNALRTAGKVGVDGGLSLLLNTAAAIGSGGLTIPLTVAGTIARKVGEGLTKSQIRQFNEAIRARSPLGQKMAAGFTPPARLSPKTDALISTILASNQLRDPLNGAAFLPIATPANVQSNR